MIKTIAYLCKSELVRKYSLTLTKQQRMAGEIVKDAAGVSLKQIIQVLESFAPVSLAEGWDNTGLLIEPYTPRAIKRILLTNDLTEDVALEATNSNCEMIISYHPPIFAPLKTIVQESWKEKVVSLLLEQRIALYSPHTSWDSVRGGVNDWLGQCLPVASSQPISQGVTPDVGCGRLIQLHEKITLCEAIERVKAHTGLRAVRVAVARGASLSTPLATVALCAGSGASVLKGVKADLYLTGEMLHHDVLDATQKSISVILTNHSDSERGFLSVFAPKLVNLLNDRGEVLVSKVDSDPLTTM